MKRIVLIALTIIVFVFLAGCAPMINVQNNTSIGIRVAIMSSNGVSVVSPAPGETVSTEATEGKYWASVMPTEEWLNFARDVRAGLISMLASPENLAPDQIIDVTTRLSDITDRINLYSNGKAGIVGYCAVKVSAESDGIVVVSENQNGSLALSCK